MHKNSDHADFMVLFAEFIVVWNHVELAARSVLEWIAGGNIGAQILVGQTGNASITDIMRLASDWHPDGKEHLVHFANMMDTVRAYRNYYVHNLIGIGNNDEHGSVGIVMSLNVKGKYKLYEKALTYEDLRETAEQSNEARKYALKILEVFKSHPEMIDRVAHFSSLEKPIMPKTLSKTARDPQAP